MKQRLALFTGVLAAIMVAAFGFAGPASAAAKEAKVTATSIDPAISKAQTSARTVCKRVATANKRARAATKRAKKLNKKAKRLNRKNRSSRAAKKAKRAARKASRTAKRVNKAKRRAKGNCNRARTAVRKLNTLKAESFFDVCVQGDCYRKVQQAADAAATFQEKNHYLATVRIQPGTYVEGVFLDGRNPAFDYNGLTIMGVKADKTPNPDARQAILEGTGAKTIVDGNAQVAQNALEARNTAGLVMKNMWARNYQNNTFFVWAATDPKPPLPPLDEYCADYVMDNLVSSDTRSYGLFARNCFGGEMTNSEGWNHGDSAFYIGETPCDDESWTNRGANPGPCQANPKWTVMDNVTSHQNVLGYSGTNSKYVEIKNSSFYNNGAGIVPNTLDSEKFEPNGWMNIHDNDIFWNNYNYYSTGSAFQTVSNGLGQVGPVTVNYPTGIGIVLYGSDGIVSKNNNIFGNEKWGAMAFSGPGAFGANDDDDAKNLNNQFIDNKLGRNGTDPNGVDFLSDNTGGGNCFVGNTATPAVTYTLGSGAVPADTIYPKSCPTTPVLNKDVSSVDLGPGSANIQIDADLNGDDPNTVLGYAAADPPESMECSWSGNTHPAFTDADGITYTQKRADPVDPALCP